MNLWAQMLADLPASAQRLVARTQRVSLPRACSADERLRRLRQALCHHATVRTMYAALDAPTQSALHELRTRRGGVRPAELAQRYGAVRSWRQLAADPRPHTISERLILLGWLLLRPARPRHPARYLIPPEVRRWLPQPLRLTPLGPAPASAIPLAVRATTAILLACAERSLRVQANGRPRRATLRALTAQLTPLPPDQAYALIDFLLPLLADLGLVSIHAGSCRLAPAGQRFLALPLQARLDQLRHAWLATPRPDAWLTALLHNDMGIDWPLLRRRLCEWADALPPDQLLEPATLYDALAAALGPLADAHTHGFRTVDRAPWQPRRAGAIFDAALRGPLQWLGLVAWHDERLVFRPVESLAAAPVEVRPAWMYGAPGEIHVAHTSADAHLLRLLPYADRLAVDSHTLIVVLSPRSIARAARRGWGADTLWALLDQQAGPIPTAWRAGLDRSSGRVELTADMVLLTAPPAVLERASRARSVRRYLSARLAPGIALIRPEHVASLDRALSGQDIACIGAPAPPESKSAMGMAPAETAQHRARQAEPPIQHPGDCAALLVACAFYRRHAPADAPLLPHDDLEQRLRLALTPPLRQATEAALADLQPRPAPAPAAEPERRPPIAETIARLRDAQERQQPVTITYNTADQGDWTHRLIRPLALEQRGETWYLRAYCTARAAERTFRVDRIGAIADVMPFPHTPAPSIAAPPEAQGAGRAMGTTAT